jgi:ubiquinone/menaquinone biosynthesis C-methylase UbiE
VTADSKYVTADYLRRTAERLVALKETSYERMRIGPGDILLDAGCGPGVDAVPLAEKVGPTGRVIAIDVDPVMLEGGKKLAAEKGLTGRIDFRVGSALGLPLADGAVAASRAERLLQVLPPADESRVVAELCRVTRPGGMVVLVDTDWGTGSVDCDDNALERRLFAFFAQRMRPNGFAGRRQYGLARGAGLRDVTVESFALIQHQLGATPLEWLADTAKAEDAISDDEHARWLGDLRRREAAGHLFFQTNMVIVAGKVPASRIR